MALSELPGSLRLVGPRRRFGAAAGFGVLSVLLAVGGLVLSLIRPRAVDLVAGHQIGDAAMALASAVVGMLILGRRPGHPVGRVFAAIGLADAFSTAASGVTDVLTTTSREYPWAMWFSEWAWVPGLLLPITLLPLVFPEGARPGWQRNLVRVEVALTIGVCLGQAFSARLQSGPDTQIANPIGLPGADTIGQVLLGTALLAGLGSLATMVLRLIKAGDRLRRQMLPLVAAGVAVIGGVVCGEFLSTPGVVIQDASLLLIPAGALLSVLRLRLYDLELAIARTASWLALSGLLIGTYILVVELAADWLHLQDRTASIIATAAIALVFGPLRTALQRQIAKVLYGDRGDPYTAMTHTTQVLSAGADPLGALQQAAADLAHRLRSPGVRILRSGILLAGVRTGTPALRVPLRNGPIEVGTLEVLPRSVGETFSASDRRLLLDLSAPLTNAVAAVGLAEDLRAARERLARAREAERRRVRNELHDDVGPSLAAAGLHAQTAIRRLEKRDIDGTAEALLTLRLTIAHAASDLRSAIDALGPRILDEAGLTGAVRSLTWSGEPAVTTDIDPTLELVAIPPAVETAVYRVIAEALTNARKHAQATTIHIQLNRNDTALHLSITDDGIGGATSTAGGIGIGSMRARIEELGGQLSIGALDTQQGTVVAATVPMS